VTSSHASLNAFPVMGQRRTRVNLVGGPPQLLARARTRIEELERLWSRFLPAS